MNASELKQQLKQLVIEECDKEDDFSPCDIDDDEPLMGTRAALDLDSLDALQISMAIHLRYGVRIEGNKDNRRAFASISALADFILANQPVDQAAERE